VWNSVEGDMGPPRETEHRSGWKDFCAELLSHLVPFEWLPPWYVVVAGIFVTLAALVYFAVEGHGAGATKQWDNLVI
jgi:hypothetical protein